MSYDESFTTNLEFRMADGIKGLDKTNKRSPDKAFFDHIVPGMYRDAVNPVEILC